MNLNELRELVRSDEANYLMKVKVTHTDTYDGIEITETVRVADVFIEEHEEQRRFDGWEIKVTPARRDAWIYGSVGRREVTIGEKFIVNIVVK